MISVQSMWNGWQKSPTLHCWSVQLKCAPFLLGKLQIIFTLFQIVFQHVRSDTCSCMFVVHYLSICTFCAPCWYTMFIMNLHRRSPLGWYELTYSGPLSTDTLIREFLIWGSSEYTVVMWECHHVEMLIHGRFGQQQKSQLCAGTHIGSVSLWRKKVSVTWFVISQHHTFIFRMSLVFHKGTWRVSPSTCSKCTCWFQHTGRQLLCPHAAILYSFCQLTTCRSSFYVIKLACRQPCMLELKVWSFVHVFWGFFSSETWHFLNG